MSATSRPPRWRRVLRVILAALGALVFLALCAVGWLHTGSGKAFVRRRVETALAKTFVGGATLGELDFTLFGKIVIGKLVIKDAEGREAVALDHLLISPVWSSLRGDRPALERLEVRGVRVHVVEASDGTTNLDRLTLPQPKPEQPKGKGKLLTEVRLAAFAIDDVRVIVDRADGAHATAALVHTEGSITAAPATRGLELSLPALTAELALDAPSGGGVAVRKITTKARAHLVNRAGEVTLGPTSAEIEIAAPGKPPRGFPFELGPIELHLEERDLRAAFDKLLLGAVSLSGFEVRAHREGDTFQGEQRAALGIHLDAKKLDALLDKQVLASDVDVDVKIGGPPNKLSIDVGAKTQGGNLDLHGDLDLADRVRQGYALHLEGKGIDTSKILGFDVAAPPITVEAVAIEAHGRGLDPATLDAEVSLKIEGVGAGDARIDAIEANARVDKGEVSLRDASVRAMGQTLKASATYRLADKKVHLELSPSGRGADATAPMRRLGLSPPPVLGSVAFHDGDVKVTVDGTVGGALHASVSGHRVALAGGRVDVDAEADLGPPPDGGGSERKVALEHAHAVITLQGIDAATLAGKALPVAATASGRVQFDGNLADPHVDGDLRIRARAAGDANAPALALTVRAETTEGRARVHLRAEDEGAGKDAAAIATGEIVASLGAGGLDRDGPISVRIDVPRRKLRDFARFAPPAEMLVPGGELEVHANIAGTARRPTGTFDVDASVPALANETQRVRAHGVLHGAKRLGGPAVDVDAKISLRDGGEAPIEVHAEVDTGGAGPGAPLAWTVVLDTPAEAIEKLPLPAARKEALAGVVGKVSAHLALHGTRDDVAGTVKVELADVTRNDRGPINAFLALDIADDAGHLDLRARARETPFLTVGGRVGVGGKGLLAALRNKRALDPDLDIAIEIPDAELAKLAPLAPLLASLPGRVHGAGSVKGKVTAPVVKLGAAADHYATLDGHPGRASVDLSGDVHGAKAKIAMGPVEGDGIDIEASLPIPEKIGLLNLPEAKAKARADAVDLRTLIPAVVLDGKPVDIRGKLDWNMDATVGVKTSLRGVGVKAEVKGDLAIHKGRIALLGSPRVLDAVELEIESDAHELRVGKLHLHEGDVEKRDRTLDLAGALGWEGLSFGHADFKFKARDWLLFGGEKMGKVDAPRGSLTADLKIQGDLEGPLKTLDAEVERLDLRFPDRFDRSHQPEQVSLGDVYELGAPGVRKGKLRQPVDVDVALKEAPPPPPKAVEEGQGFDVHVRLPKPVHVQQAPLDAMAKGGVDVEIRPGTRRIHGKLTLVSGSVGLGGKKHPLDRGTITFDDAHPGGFMDLHFARPLPPETQRDMSLASSTGAVRIDMEGPVGKQRVSLKGAGNALLFEALAVDNAGRERVFAAPGLPPSETAQLPRNDDVLALTFLAVNMPHLMYLDRITGWADPYEDRASYGRLQDVDATRTSADGHVRFKATSQPPRAGESSNAMELDWMFWNGGRSAAGVGVRGGDRGGGGPGVFLEWNSGD